MRFNILFINLFLFIFSAWSYNKPNSIAYDSASKSYFITNTVGKTVTLLDSNFNTKDIITGLTGPKDLLFATFGPYSGLLILDSNEIKVYETSAYSLVAKFPVSGALELEDAEADKTQAGTFYISDTKAHKIFKVVVGGPPFYTPTITVLSTALRNPKALLFDSKNRLLVATDTLGSEIYSVNRSNGNVNLIRKTKIDLINSLEEDLQGNFYASSWGDNYFYRLDPAFDNEKGLAIYSNPAGLYFNRFYDLMVLACSNCNKVEFHSLHLMYLNDVDSAACPGDSFYIQVNQQFKGKGTYNPSNYFYAELSDEKGGFLNPVRLGSIKDVIEPVYMKLTLPESKRFKGKGYQIRLRSTSPPVISYNSLDVYVPHVPQSKLQKDSITFCIPSLLNFGLKNDPDSGACRYSWYFNKNLTDSVSAFYTDTFKTGGTLKLIKRSTESTCISSDSTILEGRTAIDIPFKNVHTACEGNVISLGGDSMDATTIQWHSVIYPGMLSGFNPSYIVKSNDTIWVKIVSLGGNCASEDTLYVNATERPEVSTFVPLRIGCTNSSIQLVGNLDKGIQDRIVYSWKPKMNLSQYNEIQAYFSSSNSGIFDFVLTAKDTLYNCSDSVGLRINNVETPEKPVLKSMDTTVYLTNYRSGFNYKWWLNGVLQQNQVTDSVLKVNIGTNRFGLYRIKVENPSYDLCSDSSSIELFKPVNVKTAERLRVKIFPNPGMDVVHILSDPGEGSWEITDLSARICLQGKLENDTTIDVSKINSGLYYIKLNFEDSILIQKFIKK
ncbi:MAG: T9SS type A sorting domain-containing protein [Flavobacteriales bacterium]|nr:T9SS type A sorting domain-containing protein [Flavobacteriales bacterium]